MPSWQYDFNASVASERQWLILPSRFSTPQSTPVVMWHHGAGGETYWIEPKNGAAGLLPEHHAIFNALLARGFALYAADFGTPADNRWGNDHAMSRLDSADTWLTAAGFTKKRVLMGTSMGHMTVFNWAHRNIAKVSALVGLIPVTDAAWVFTNYAPAAAPMNAAYNGTGTNLPTGNWAANAATRDPTQLGASVVGAIPARFYYAADDTQVGDSVGNSETLAALSSNWDAIAGTSAGHTDASLAAVDEHALARWLWGVV